MRTILWVLSILCVSRGLAMADDPPVTDAPVPGAPPAAAPSAGAPAPDAPPPERVRQLADTLDTLADLAGNVGLDTGSREAARLASTARVAADYAELALLVAQANAPQALTTYWAATLGAGGRATPDRALAGELALTAGVAITGPTCTLLDVNARLALATTDGLALAQGAQLCLGAIELVDDAIPAAHHATALAINAHQAAGINVRPSVDAAAVTDRSRFTLAEAGLSLEGLRYFWARRRWSIAAPMVAMSQSVLTHEVDDARETLLRLTASAWFVELRYHRDRTALADFTLRFFPIAVDQVESGDAISTLSIVPLELRGLGTRGVYVDAAGGLDVTAEETGDTPEMIAARPDLGVGAWRLALNVGEPRTNAALVWRQHLAPTLRDAVIIERRASATVHVELPAAYVAAEAYRANLRYFEGPGDVVDARYDTWGVQGEAWIRAGTHLLVGASAEVGRTFVFAEPTAGTPGTPPLGYLALVQLGWRASATRALD